MRHKVKGRTLGRNASHRHAMFRNMAASFIRTVRPGEDDPNKPKVEGRIITTVAKAKELRPYIEKLVTAARKAAIHERAAAEFATAAKRNSNEWKTWRESEQYQKWNQTIAPAVNLRRKAFALLRDKLAVEILFDELAKRFETRDGGYTRIVKIATRRLGDSGHQALIEFVGVHDRVKQRRARTAPVAAPAPEAAPAAEAPAAPAAE
ncbi:MAG: 50S ribosomal protein L17 [Planctomycetes bacterium]|nr:50S ribosomal protein L17 [Planctomycetota bacterium]